MPRLRTGTTLNKCINFNQTNSVVTFTVPSSMDPANMVDFTVVCWLYFRTLIKAGSSPRIFDTADADGGFFMAFRDTNDNGVVNIKSTGSFGALSLPRGSVKVGEWFHFAMRWVDSTKTISFFINGQPITGVSPTTLSGSRGNWSGGTGYVGNRSTTDINLDGLMDDFRIYNEALTDEEILTDFSNMEAKTGSTLLLWYKMDETSGSLTDSSSSSLTGTASNVTQNVTSFSRPARTQIT